MSLIVILVCLGATYWWRDAQKYRQFSWFNLYMQKVDSFLAGQTGWQFIVRYLLVLLPMPIIVGLAVCLFEHVFLGLIGFILSIIVLWYSIAAVPNEAEYADYFSARRNHDEKQIREQAQKFLDREAPADLDECTVAVVGHQFARSNSDLFAVLFWFLILGPAGALGYRLVIQSQTLNHAEIDGFAAKLQSWLDYIPARLVSLSFSLMGHFIAVIGYLMTQLTASPKSNSTLLANSGFAALGLGPESLKTISIEEHQEAIHLIQRSLITWLVVIALMVVVNLLS